MEKQADGRYDIDGGWVVGRMVSDKLKVMEYIHLSQDLGSSRAGGPGLGSSYLA